MIPILYEKNETDFTHNGLGYLVDTVKATVPEERNGAYELSFQYPITGARYSLITEGAIVKCKLDDSRGSQLFRIYKSSKPLKGIVTFSAEHISYDLNGLPLAGFSAGGVSPQVAIAKALNETPITHSFSVTSDIATLNRTEIKDPCSVRGLLGGREGSILDVWGGEYEFDNFEIKLHAQRGADNGVTIEYGKNLTDIKQEANIADCYTHILPYAVYTVDDGSGNAEDVYVYLTEKTIQLANAPNLGHDRAFIYDCSGEFEDGEVPTEAKIRTLTNKYIEDHDLVTPKVNIKVSFINLADTIEYKNIAPLERVRLCDTVAVKFTALGVTAKAKVIKTVYDVLNERYENVTIGDAKSSFADTVNKQRADMNRITAQIAQNKSRAEIELENAIADATAAITGQSGGYIILNPSENPQELLILDAQSGGDIEQAVNVWRFNSAGLGHSSTGYNGNYTTAITHDGKIIGSFIAAHTIAGEAIVAGGITANEIAQSFKTSITNEIGASAASLSQSFQAADGALLSKIEEIVQSDGSSGTKLSTILGNYSTISQTSTAITTAVSTKVDNSEWGTKIQQSANDIKIAWNNISSSIQLENAQMNIYDGTDKVISFNSDGEDIYYGGYKIGRIGSDYWTGDNTKRGISFQLDTDGAFMAWTRGYGSGYQVELMYTRESYSWFTANTFYLFSEMNFNGNYLTHPLIKDWDFDGGSVTGTFSGYYATQMNNDGTMQTWRSFSLTFKNGILQSASW